MLPDGKTKVLFVCDTPGKNKIVTKYDDKEVKQCSFQVEAKKVGDHSKCILDGKFGRAFNFFYATSLPPSPHSQLHVPYLHTYSPLPPQTPTHKYKSYNKSPAGQRTLPPRVCHSSKPFAQSEIFELCS